jgi:hypothetical protein
MANPTIRTDYWFPAILTDRLLKALAGRNFNSVAVTYTVHRDDDKAMLDALLGQNVTDPQTLREIRKMLAMFIIGFEAAHGSMIDSTTPKLIARGRNSMNWVDQFNHVSADRQSVEEGGFKPLYEFTKPEDAQKAVYLAFTAIQQFCFMNGMPYKQQREE